VGGTINSKAGRHRRKSLPRNGQRERVLHIVRAHGDAIDAVELASRIGLHVTTVRSHLDALCDDGAIERTRMNRDGVGRPRTGYRAVEERLDYRILAEILAMELGGTTEARARRAQRIGVEWAARIAATHGRPGRDRDEPDAASTDEPLDRGAALATEVFDRMGFHPELAAESEPTASLSVDSKQILGHERVIRLRACPVRDLARAHPDVGCGIHLGLLQGLIDHAAATGAESGTREEDVSARLEPFVEPELCIARLNGSRRRARG
jgi:predicted ArsR family transcriptional regulator